MSLLNRLFAPPPPPKTPFEKIVAMVDAGKHMDAILYAKETHLGHDLAFLLIERMRSLPPAERIPLRAVVAAALWDDERPMTPEQAITAARFYLERSDGPGAEGALSHILRFDESHAEALYLRALAMVRRNRFGDALMVLETVLTLDPEHRHASRARATLGKLARFHPPALVGESRPLLVALGGDVEAIVRATPLLRTLADALGHPIDVAVAREIADDRIWLVAREGVTDQVFWFGKTAFRQRYTRVLLTEGFGELHPLFSADEVHSARDWDAHDPARGVDPERHAIEVAAALLDFTAPAALPAPYVGNLPEVATGDRSRVALLPRSLTRGAPAGEDADWAAIAAALTACGLTPVVLGLDEVPVLTGVEAITCPSLEVLAGHLAGCGGAVAASDDGATMANALGLPTVAFGSATRPLREDIALRTFRGDSSTPDAIAAAVAEMLA